MNNITKVLFGLVFTSALLMLSKCSDDPATDAVPLPDDLLEFFDAAFLPSESYIDEEKTTKVSDGQPVAIIEDLIGGNDMEYRGIVGHTPIAGARESTLPVYYESEGGYIFLPNSQRQQYYSKIDDVEQPFELFFVVRPLQTINNESLIVGTFMPGLKFVSTSFLRMSMDKAGDFPAGVGIPEWNKMLIIRGLYNGAESKVWYNNVDLGGTVDVGQERLKHIPLGSNGHGHNYDWFGTFVHYGKFTDEEANKVYELLAAKHTPDAFPNAPFANNLTVEWNNTEKSWTVNYDYENPLGIPEDIAATEYQWFFGGYNSGTDLNNQTNMIGPNSQNKTLKRSDYPDIFTNPDDPINNPLPSYAWIYCAVRVYDTEGNTWKELQGPWERDNIE